MIADGLITRENDIMAANKKDLEAATRDGITGPMFSRLALSRYKKYIKSLFSADLNSANFD